MAQSTRVVFSSGTQGIFLMLLPVSTTINISVVVNIYYLVTFKTRAIVVFETDRRKSVS
jgi:hypothetical protein